MGDVNIYSPNNVHAEMKMVSAIKRRRVLLHDEIHKESVFETCFYLNRILELDAKTRTKEPIFLDICSYGGSVFSGFEIISLLDYMVDIGYEVTTTVTGCAMSMGQLIALCGTKRRGYRHARYLIHAIISGCYDSLQGMIDEVEESKYLWNQIKKHIISKTKITDEQLEFYKERKKDWTFNSQEALELGVIDEIL